MWNLQNDWFNEPYYLSNFTNHHEKKRNRTEISEEQYGYLDGKGTRNASWEPLRYRKFVI